jgi:hypothetical protein
LKEREKGRKEDEEEVNRYWMNLRKRKDRNLKDEAVDRTFGGQALEHAMDL